MEVLIKDIINTIGTILGIIAAAFAVYFFFNSTFLDEARLRGILTKWISEGHLTVILSEPKRIAVNDVVTSNNTPGILVASVGPDDISGDRAILMGVVGDTDNPRTARALAVFDRNIAPHVSITMPIKVGETFKVTNGGLGGNIVKATIAYFPIRLELK